MPYSRMGMDQNWSRYDYNVSAADFLRVSKRVARVAGQAIVQGLQGASIEGASAVSSDLARPTYEVSLDAPRSAVFRRLGEAAKKYVRDEPEPLFTPDEQTWLRAVAQGDANRAHSEPFDSRLAKAVDALSMSDGLRWAHHEPPMDGPVV